MNDLRFALRMLRRNPAFAAAAVLTLALGIGANTAIFSVVDAYLLRPLSHPHADRLVTVRDVQPGWGETPASFEEWRDLTGSHYLMLFGRLPEGMTLDRARTELDQVAARLQEERGTTHGWAIAPLRDQLAGLAAALGALIGIWGAPLLADALAASIPRPGRVGVDHRVLAFTAAVAVGTALLFGLAPALLEMRREGGIPGGSRAVSGGRGARRAREGRVVAELALSLVLLIGAGLLMQSFHRLLRVDPGFAADGLLTVSTTLPSARYGEPAQRLAFVEDVAGRIAGLPGVRSVAVANHLPLTGRSMSGDLTIEGRVLEEADRPHVEKRVVSERNFEALGIALRRGRLFGPGDGAESPPVVVISEATAHHLWPGDEALGKRIRSLTCGECWEEVVGVVANVRERALAEAAPLQVYYPIQQVPLAAMRLVVRTEADPAGLVAPIRRAVAHPRAPRRAHRADRGAPPRMTRGRESENGRGVRDTAGSPVPCRAAGAGAGGRVAAGASVEPASGVGELTGGVRCRGSMACGRA